MKYFKPSRQTIASILIALIILMSVFEAHIILAEQDKKLQGDIGFLHLLIRKLRIPNYGIIVLLNKPKVELKTDLLLEKLQGIMDPEGTIYYRGLEDHILIGCKNVEVDNYTIPIIVIYTPTVEHYTINYCISLQATFSIRIKPSKADDLASTLKKITSNIEVRKEANSIIIKGVLRGKLYEGFLSLSYSLHENLGTCSIYLKSPTVSQEEINEYKNILRYQVMSIISKLGSVLTEYTLTDMSYDVEFKPLSKIRVFYNVNVDSLNWHNIVLKELERLLDLKIVKGLSKEDIVRIASIAKPRAIIFYYDNMWTLYTPLPNVYEAKAIVGTYTSTRAVKTSISTLRGRSITTSLTKTTVTVTPSITPTPKTTVEERALSGSVKPKPLKAPIRVITHTIYTTVTAYSKSTIEPWKALVVFIVTVLSGLIAYILIRRVLIL